MFYICEHCGNIVGMIKNTGVPLICCGEPMKEIIPGSVDASLEKHVPAATVEGNTVTVQIGSAIHPMIEEHHIEWICLESEHGRQRKALKAGQEPKAVFVLVDDKPVKVYAYCNIHGLWKTDL